VRLRFRPYREQKGGGEGAIGDNLTAVNGRLDDLSHQIARIAGAKTDAHAGGSQAQTVDRVADALARLDRRLDQIFHDGRAGADMHHPSRPLPPAKPSPAPAAAALAGHGRGPAQWAAQISARQSALDGGGPAPAIRPPTPVMTPPPARSPRIPSPPVMSPPAPMMAQPPMPPAPMLAAHAPASDLSAVEHQLRQINSQISALHQPYESGLTALRNDLSEIGRTLHEAMPRRAIEALESDVRALAERLDRTKQAGADGSALGSLEHGLEEVRDAWSASRRRCVRCRTRSTRSRPTPRAARAATILWRSSSSSRRSCRCAAPSPTSPPTAR
jgi:localization factor PodJL